MRNHRNPVADLAAKAGNGDANARLQLRDQLASQMVFIVRRTLQTGKETTSLDRRILAEARRLDALDPEQRIHAIAHVLCGNVLTNLRAAPMEARGAQETVVELGSAAI